MSDPGPQTAAPKPAAPAATEVVIDRLVFDVPGLGAEEAKALAGGLADRLARAGVSGDHASVGVTLGPLGGSQADLAARIAAALMQRLA
jgi:hypothetical protein